MTTTMAPTVPIPASNSHNGNGEEAALARDPMTGDYVLRVIYEIRVSGDYYGRRWNTSATEENIDFSDPEVLAKHARKVGRADRWWNEQSPYVKRTLLPATTMPPAAPRSQSQEISPPRTRVEAKAPEPRGKGKTKAEMMEEYLCARARVTPPSLWLDLCRTPVAPLDLPKRGSEDWLLFETWARRETPKHPHGINLEALSPEHLLETWKKGYRPDIGRRRNEEKDFLQWLTSEWNESRFQVSAEALEKEYPSSEKLEAIRDAVNGHGFH